MASPGLHRVERYVIRLVAGTEKSSVDINCSTADRMAGGGRVNGNRLLKVAAAQTGRYATVLPRLALSALNPGFVELRHDAFKSLARELSLIWNARMLQVRPLAKQVSVHLKEAFSGRNKIG